jgi:hypothetical protein
MPYLIHIYDPFLRWQVLEVLYVNRRLLDPTEYRPNVPQPGETMGKPWENRGKIVGKSWENMGTSWENRSNPRIGDLHGLCHMISGYGNGIYPRYYFWVVLEIGGSPVVTKAL